MTQETLEETTKRKVLFETGRRMPPTGVYYVTGMQILESIQRGRIEVFLGKVFIVDGHPMGDGEGYETVRFNAYGINGQLKVRALPRREIEGSNFHINPELDQVARDYIRAGISQYKKQQNISRQN